MKFNLDRNHKLKIDKVLKVKKEETDIQNYRNLSMQEKQMNYQNKLILID